VFSLVALDPRFRGDDGKEGEIAGGKAAGDWARKA
jgi:hypothetical protein